MGNFGKSAKGGPFAKLSILAIFLAQLRQARKSSILVRFEPNQYGRMRNLFQFGMIPKTLSNNKNQLRNRNISKGYSKWAILAKVQRGDPLRKLSILAIFLAQLRQARKSSILVRFEPNQYGRIRNLFQFGIIPKTLSNNKKLAEKSQYFQRVLKMGNFGKSAKGGPFAKLSILAIFLAQLRQARKSSILVRFEPNQYGWIRNLFQFLMIPKTLSNNKNQLRNRNISKGYSKWAILAKVQRGYPLQNSRFWPFSWPNFVRLENRQYQCDLSLISMDGCEIYSSF